MHFNVPSTAYGNPLDESHTDCFFIDFFFLHQFKAQVIKSQTKNLVYSSGRSGLQFWTIWITVLDDLDYSSGRSGLQFWTIWITVLDTTQSTANAQDHLRTNQSHSQNYPTPVQKHKSLNHELKKTGSQFWTQHSQQQTQPSENRSLQNQAHLCRLFTCHSAITD